jgi:hypothetical protein
LWASRWPLRWSSASCGSSAGTRTPLVPLRIFSNRSLADATMLLLAAALFGMFFFCTLYLQQVLGYRRVAAGSKLDAFKDEIHRLLAEDPKLPGVRL